MHIFLIWFLLAVATSAQAAPANNGGFEAMATTTTRRADVLTVWYNGVQVVGASRDAFGGFNGSQVYLNVFGPTPALTTQKLFPGQSVTLVYSWVPGSPFVDTISISALAKVVGARVAPVLVAQARDHFGNIILLGESGVISERICFINSGNPVTGTEISGSAGNETQIAASNSGAPTAIAGFLPVYFGGPVDDWGSPEISSAPTTYTASSIRVKHVLTNVGDYAVHVYFQMATIELFYYDQASTNMSGSGTTVATVQRGIAISSAMTGSGAVTTAANAVSQGRKIVAAVVGSGVTNASVRKDVAGVISVYGEAHVKGSGTVTVPTITRLIPIPGAMVGSGSVSATPQRGIPGKAWNKFFVGDPSIGFPGAMIGSGVVTATINRIQKIVGAFVGSGVVTLTGLQRMIKVVGAFVGSGAVTMAANSVSQVRKIVGAFVGSGVVTTTVQRGIKIPAAFVGSGVVTMTLQRMIKIIGNFVGSGTVVGEVFAGSRVLAPEDRTFTVPEWDAHFIVPEQVNYFEVT